MNQFLLTALLVTSLVSAVSVFTAKAQSKRAKKAEEALREAFTQVKARAEQLQKALGENQKAEEAANAERKELAQAADADLVGRANNLFR